MDYSPWGGKVVQHDSATKQQQHLEYIKNTYKVYEYLDLSSGLVLKIYLLMQDIQVQSLAGEDPMEKEMATHSSILAWETPWTEEPGGLQSLESQKSQTGLCG